MLLLALLHGLGIEAVPAVVSTRFGDGMDQRLPMIGLFDHILVRTTIAGHVYWLDGTRTGDRRLADISVPPFRWALPIRPKAAVLERLPEVPATTPFASVSIRIDATAGIGQPAPFHAETVTRADQATQLRLSLANMTPEVRDRALRDYWTKQYDFLTVKAATASYDEKTGEERLVVDGAAAMDWSHQSYEADGMGLGWSADFARPPGPHGDAPFAVGFPGYERASETILLPNGGKGFAVDTPDVDRTIGAVEYHRRARLKGATYTVEKSIRSLAPEFPASEAAADQAALRALAKERVFVNVGGGYTATPQEKAALLANEPKTATDYVQRGGLLLQQQDWRGAEKLFTQAIAMNAKQADAFTGRGFAEARLRDLEAARADYGKALAIDPHNISALVARADLARSQKRLADALAYADEALAIQADNLDALRIRAWADSVLGRTDQVMADMSRLADHGDAYSQVALAMKEGRYAAALPLIEQAMPNYSDNVDLIAWRAQARDKLGRYDEALADSDDAIKRAPQRIDLYLLRANIYRRLGKPDLCVKQAAAVVAANPDSDYAHVVAGAIYAHAHQPRDAEREFDRAIALKPTLYAYLTRAENRAKGDIDGRRADIEAAQKLQPDSLDVRIALLRIDLETKDYAALLTASDAVLHAHAEDREALLYRGIAYDQTGRRELAEKDFAALRAGNDPTQLNNFCWEKATRGVALQSALTDCDLALAKRPSDPAALDSRAFVLLRLGRYSEALESYDQAVRLRPTQAGSLYGRGLTKLRLGRTAEGEADLAAARKADGQVAAEFQGYGLTA